MFIPDSRVKAFGSKAWAQLASWAKFKKLSKVACLLKHPQVLKTLSENLIFDLTFWETLIVATVAYRLSLYGTWKQEYLPTEMISSHWTKSQKQFTVEFYEQSPPSKHLALNQIKTY